MNPDLPAPPHRARFPDPTGHFTESPPGDSAFIKELVSALQREFDRLQRGVAQPQVLLLAPDNSVWALRVSNAGALSATKIVTTGILP